MWSMTVWWGLQVHNKDYLILDDDMLLNFSYLLRNWLFACQWRPVEATQSLQLETVSVNEVFLYENLVRSILVWLALATYYKRMACVQCSSSRLLSSPAKSAWLLWAWLGRLLFILFPCLLSLDSEMLSGKAILGVLWKRRRKIPFQTTYFSW